MGIKADDEQKLYIWLYTDIDCILLYVSSLSVIYHHTGAILSNTQIQYVESIITNYRDDWHITCACVEYEPTIASLSIVIAVEVTRDHIHTFTNTIAILVAVVFTVPRVIVTVEVASNCVLTYTAFTYTEEKNSLRRWSISWIVCLFFILPHLMVWRGWVFLFKLRILLQHAHCLLFQRSSCLWPNRALTCTSIIYKANMLWPEPFLECLCIVCMYVLVCQCQQLMQH